MLKRNILMITASALTLAACGEKYTIPPGAVVAFELNSCPNSQWEQYEEAAGRFIRGWNPRTDPGQIAIGSLTDDQVGDHMHVILGATRNGATDTGDFPDKRVNRFPDGPKYETYNTKSEREVPHLPGENLPKAVTLLYCKLKN